MTITEENTPMSDTAVKPSMEDLRTSLITLVSALHKYATDVAWCGDFEEKMEEIGLPGRVQEWSVTIAPYFEYTHQSDDMQDALDAALRYIEDYGLLRSSWKYSTDAISVEQLEGSLGVDLRTDADVDPVIARVDVLIASLREAASGHANSTSEALEDLLKTLPHLVKAPVSRTYRIEATISYYLNATSETGAYNEFAQLLSDALPDSYLLSAFTRTNG